VRRAPRLFTDVTSAPGKLGKLYVVATPIGNMGDFAGRAREVLRSVDVVAAEDQRVTGRLLERFGITAKLLSYRDENERQLAPRLVRRVARRQEHRARRGRRYAVYLGSGIPARSCGCGGRNRGRQRAGPSAVVALLAISGLPTDRFAFEGFPPARAGARRELLESLRGTARTVVFYESPRRIGDFLAEIADVLSDPEVAVGGSSRRCTRKCCAGARAKLPPRSPSGVRAASSSSPFTSRPPPSAPVPTRTRRFFVCWRKA
jgi:16S rRNA (cytidine1402-2'-O)-methyltransferase